MSFALVLSSIPSVNGQTDKGFLLTRATFDIATSSDRCTIDVNMKPNPSLERAAWFDIWAAGVEIHTLGVQHGLSGMVHYLGDLLQTPYEGN